MSGIAVSFDGTAIGAALKLKWRLKMTKHLTIISSVLGASLLSTVVAFAGNASSGYANGSLAARARCEAQGMSYVPTCVQWEPDSDPSNPFGQKCVRTRMTCSDAAQPN